MGINLFTEQLNKFFDRDKRTAGQVAQQIKSFCQTTQPISRETVYRWLDSDKAPKRPRQWQYIVQLAVALNLTEAETNKLLLAAKHQTVLDFLSGLSDEEEVATWLREIQARATPSLAPFQAPAKQTDFIAHPTVFEHVRSKLLARNDPQVIILQGMLGIGKTTLAIQLAHYAQTAFTDGVLWLNMSELSTQEALQLAAVSYGYDFDHLKLPSLESRAAYIRQLFSEQQTLLIFDNVQRAEQITPFMSGLGTSVFLVTTRHHDLNWPLNAMTCDLTPLDEKLADALYEQHRTQAGNDSVHKEHLIEWAGGVPLALNLPDLMLASVDGALLSSPQVQQVFQAEWGQLPLDLQELLLDLVVFEGVDFETTAVASIVNMPLPLVKRHLQNAAKRSLLVTPKPHRYQLHTLRQSFLRQTRAPTAEMQQRKHDYYLSFMAANRRVYDALAIEAVHLENALSYLRDKSEDARLIQAILDLCSWWLNQGQRDRMRQHLETAHRLVEKEQNVWAQMELSFYAALLEKDEGNYLVATSHYRAGLRLSQHLPASKRKHELIGRIYNGLATLADTQANTSHTEHLYEQAWDAATKAKNADLLTMIRMNQAILSQAQQQTNQADMLYRQALDLSTPTDTRRASVLYNYGVFHYDQGNYVAAEELLKEALVLARKKDDRRRLARILINLGLTLHKRSQPHRARQYLEEGLALATATGDQQDVSRVLTSLASLYEEFDEPGRAEDAYLEAVDLARGRQQWLDLVRILTNLADYYLRQGDFASAQERLVEARQLAEQEKLTAELADVLYRQARLMYKLGQHELALQTGRSSLAWYQQVGHVRVAEVQAWLQQHEDV